MRALHAALALACALPSTALAQFTYEPAGDLVPGSGDGLETTTVHAPDMRFPLETGPAYANSQVWGAGGLYGPGGGQCSASNYSYPWRDNYCETRDYAMPLCPSGVGHQGQDIRPRSCADDTHWAVAAESGTITHVGSYSVYLQGQSGVTHRYLHMSAASVQVRAGQNVTRGQRLGRVSDNYGGTATTIHLHFDLKKYVAGYGNVYVSPYLSLVRSYERLIGTPAVETSPPAEQCVPAPVAGAENELFKDLPAGALGKAHAEALFRADITTGCSQSPRLFCPECKVKRWMMAVFLVRAAGLSTASPPAVASFSDVPKTLWYFPYVEAAKAAGITRGCNEAGTEFCPEQDVTRGEAAAFLHNTLGWPLSNPATPSFVDVPKTAWNYKQIETLKALCITNGCSATQYCPDESLTRAQAAIFIARAFDLEDLNGCVAYCDAASCDDGSFCEDWGACEGFADACDETGTEKRTCVSAGCTGSPTNGTCTTTETPEQRACQRDTDGLEVVAPGPWSACGGFDGACDATGTRTRSRGVCRGGASQVEVVTESCTREVNCPPDVLEPDAEADTLESPDTVEPPDTFEPDTLGPDTLEPDAQLADTLVADTAAPLDTTPSVDGTNERDTGGLVVEVVVAEPAARKDEGCGAGGQGGAGAAWLLALGLLARRSRTRARLA